MSEFRDSSQLLPFVVGVVSACRVDEVDTFSGLSHAHALGLETGQKLLSVLVVQEASEVEDDAVGDLEVDVLVEGLCEAIPEEGVRLPSLPSDVVVGLFQHVEVEGSEVSQNRLARHIGAVVAHSLLSGPGWWIGPGLFLLFFLSLRPRSDG